MEVIVASSKLVYNLLTGRIQPTYTAVIIHLLSTMDIPVGAIVMSHSLHRPFRWYPEKGDGQISPDEISDALANPNFEMPQVGFASGSAGGCGGGCLPREVWMDGSKGDVSRISG